MHTIAGRDETVQIGITEDQSSIHLRLLADGDDEGQLLGSVWRERLHDVGRDALIVAREFALSDEMAAVLRIVREIEHAAGEVNYSFGDLKEDAGDILSAVDQSWRQCPWCGERLPLVSDFGGQWAAESGTDLRMSVQRDGLYFSICVVDIPGHYGVEIAQINWTVLQRTGRDVWLLARQFAMSDEMTRALRMIRETEWQPGAGRYSFRQVQTNVAAIIARLDDTSGCCPHCREHLPRE